MNGKDLKLSAATPDTLQTSNHQTLVDTHFQLHAAEWRDIYNQVSVEGRIYRKRLEIVLSWIDELALQRGSHILEIGCGGGRCTVALAQRGYLVQALDSVTEMLTSTQEQAAEAGVSSTISTTVGDAHALTFPNSCFGLVLAIGVLPYLHSPQKALREMARVLKPGGFLLVTVGNRWRLSDILDPWLCPPLQPAKRVIATLLRRFRKPRPNSSSVPLRFDSLRDLERCLSSVGLVKIKTTTVGFPPFTFHGRRIIEGRTSIRLNNWLQRLVDRGVPVIRTSGMDYVVLAKKEWLSGF